VPVGSAASQMSQHARHCCGSGIGRLTVTEHSLLALPMRVLWGRRFPVGLARQCSSPARGVAAAFAGPAGADPSAEAAEFAAPSAPACSECAGDTAADLSRVLAVGGLHRLALREQPRLAYRLERPGDDWRQRRGPALRSYCGLPPGCIA
jgi:hypothetical protein